MGRIRTARPSDSDGSPDVPNPDPWTAFEVSQDFEKHGSFELVFEVRNGEADSSGHGPGLHQVLRGVLRPLLGLAATPRAPAQGEPREAQCRQQCGRRLGHRRARLELVGRDAHAVPVRGAVVLEDQLQEVRARVEVAHVEDVLARDDPPPRRTPPRWTPSIQAKMPLSTPKLATTFVARRVSKR